MKNTWICFSQEIKNVEFNQHKRFLIPLRLNSDAVWKNVTLAVC